MNMTMGNLHTRRQVPQSTRKKPPDTDMEYKRKNVVFCINVDPSTIKEGGGLLRSMRTITHHINQIK